MPDVDVIKIPSKKNFRPNSRAAHADLKDEVADLFLCRPGQVEHIELRDGEVLKLIRTGSFCDTDLLFTLTVQNGGAPETRQLKLTDMKVVVRDRSKPHVVQMPDEDGRPKRISVDELPKHGQPTGFRPTVRIAEAVHSHGTNDS